MISTESRFCAGGTVFNMLSVGSSRDSTVMASLHPMPGSVMELLLGNTSRSGKWGAPVHPVRERPLLSSLELFPLGRDSAQDVLGSALHHAIRLCGHRPGLLHHRVCPCKVEYLALEYWYRQYFDGLRHAVHGHECAR